MPDKLIFLSHIHEEAKLAAVFRKAIEEEFAGVVEVFVSSGGKSIPVGAPFLKTIERGLVDCKGAIYLISPASVKRNWINFELGAVDQKREQREKRPASNFGDTNLPFRLHSGESPNAPQQPQRDSGNRLLTA